MQLRCINISLCVASLAAKHMGFMGKQSPGAGGHLATNRYGAGQEFAAQRDMRMTHFLLKKSSVLRVF